MPISTPTTIRSPRAGEETRIRGLVREAFGSDEPEEGERVAVLLDALRTYWSAGRGFELVAEADGALAGHVGMTPAYVDGLERLHRVLVLSPLSVGDAFRGRGVGTALAKEALARARDAGYPLVFLEGAPGYYERLGFVPAGPAGFTKPSRRIPDAAFMVARLDPRAAVSGALVYPEVFWETDTVGLRGALLSRLCPELFTDA
jgi:putative acetyltransferase